MNLLVSMGLAQDTVRGKRRRAALRRIDWEQREVTQELRWSPVDVVAPGPEEDCEFTTGFLTGNLLLQSTRNEVLWIDTTQMKVVRRFSHPLFYDVHSVMPRPEGGFVVTSTGNESVLEFDDDNGLIRHWFLRECEFESQYPGVKDFRVLPFDRYKNQATYSGHSHHPNFAFYRGRELWVTLFETRECRCLSDSVGRIGLPEGPPHDGCLREGLLWFTTTNGHIIAVDPITLQRRLHLDLRSQLKQRGLYGWCRGIEVEGRRCWVGLTPLRSSRLRGLFRTVFKGEDWRKCPTRVVEIDLDSAEVLATMDVGNEVGDSVFGIYSTSSAVS